MRGTGSQSESGFTLPEFLIAALIFLVVASSVFALLKDVQRSASYQTEVQSVLDNTRLAMQTIGRCLRQAGNDPLKTGVTGITMISPAELRVTADLTGSAGSGNPDKGDPDGDTLDSGENVTLRYNVGTRSMEAVTGSGAVQVIAGSISGLLFQCYNATGTPAAAGEAVHKVKVTISGASLLRDPETGRPFGLELSSDFDIATT